MKFFHRPICTVPLFIYALAAVVLTASPAARAIPVLCEDQCFSRQDNGLFSCQHNCGSNIDRQRIPAGLEFLAHREQVELHAPVVKTAVATPDPAAPGDAVHITITMQKDADPSDLPTVTVYYSLDAMKTWRATRAEFDPKDKSFNAFFVAPVDAENIDWFVRALSSDENAYIEIPCEVKSFPFGKDECLVPLVGDGSYADYEGFTVDPALDILQGKIGEDKDNYYLLYVTNGDISPGEKLNSLKFMYFAGFIDPAEYFRIEPLENVMFLIYAPQLYHPETCALLARRGPYWSSDTASVTCIADKNMLMFKVKKKLLMSYKSGITNIFLGANAITDIDWGVIKDYTGITSVRRISRRIVLKEAATEQSDK